MTPTKGIIEYVCEYYEGKEGLDDITFIPEFPGKRHDLPLRGKIVSVGIDRVRVMPAENAVKIANNASPATMRIKMCIYVLHRPPTARTATMYLTALSKIRGTL